MDGFTDEDTSMTLAGLVERIRNLQCPVTGRQVAAMVRAGHLHRDGQNVWADPAPDDVTPCAASHRVTERHAPKKPWSTPTVTEIPLNTLPTELRMMALGLAVDKPKPKYRPEDLPF
jgi:hypothetical protein